LDLHDSLALCRLISDSHNDIILKTDCDGFIRYASPGISQLGLEIGQMLIWPHLLDLVDDDCRPAIRNALKAALAGHPLPDWTEFSASSRKRKRNWFALRLGPLDEGAGRTRGALGVVRSLGAAKDLEERLFRAELTDPLTGLTNRQAWIGMLRHLVDSASPACLALIDIDHFRAINLHHGVSTGDNFLVAFADYLRSLTPQDVSISRVGGGRFAMLFAGWQAGQAEGLCRDIVRVLSELRCADWQSRFSITASVGIAPVAVDVDRTIFAVESALRLSRAKGGNTVTSSGAATAAKAIAGRG
jgi:diguanylate cyclase (GGDEF)-like protein/PAS domain S-box-containing protein